MNPPPLRIRLNLKPEEEKKPNVERLFISSETFFS